MRRIRLFFLVGTLGVAVGLATFACAKKEAPAAVTQAQTPAPPSNGGKIPVTTASAEAKSEFLQGRDLAEKLRITDSHAHFEKAASLDPHFALAELNLANSAPTGKEFFEHLGKAVSLADNASNGEKLLILATEAGANNNPAKQKEYLDQLVAAYPNDERAHFNLGGYYFGQQDFPQAIEHYRKATEIAPSYSSAWNLLGYAYRQNVDCTPAAPGSLAPYFAAFSSTSLGTPEAPCSTMGMLTSFSIFSSLGKSRFASPLNL
jgi:tetratricopeptide (TPR) repeat protein